MFCVLENIYKELLKLFKICTTTKCIDKFSVNCLFLFKLGSKQFVQLSKFDRKKEIWRLSPLQKIIE